MKLIVVSFCKNEAQTIAEVIQRIPKKIKGISKINIVIFDDGSTDETARVAHQAGAQVISDGANRGLAFRFREAVELALQQQADIMANIDGDLQFNPEDIPTMIEPVINGRADFAAADRFTDPKTGQPRKPANMPLGKYIGNQLGAKVTSRLAKESFKDVTCGFRAYNREALFALNTNSRHTYTQESFQVLSLKKLRIETVPVEVKYFPGRKSRVVTSIGSYIVISGLNILRAYRDFAPLRFFFGLGLVPFILGLICVAVPVIHWFLVGGFSPYKFLGISGLYLISLGFFLWGLGVVADMQVRVMNTQEKTLEQVRRMRYDKK